MSVATPSPARASIRRRVLAVLAILLLLAVLALAATVPGQVLWPLIAARLDDMRAAAAAEPAMVVMLYWAAFTALTAVCLPVGPLSAVLGGALFGMPGGAAAAIAAAVGGATMLFLLARRRPVAHLRAAVAQDGFWRLLALRLAPVVPGWVLSVASGSAGMKLLPFVAASALGIVPAFALFARVGASLQEALLGTTGQVPALDALLRPADLLAVLGLALLVAVPVLVRAVRISRTAR